MAALLLCGRMSTSIDSFGVQIPRGREVCMLEVDDPQAGTQQGRSSIVTVQGYYNVSDVNVEYIFLTNLRNGFMPERSVSFTDGQLNVNSVILWLQQVRNTMNLARAVSSGEMTQEDANDLNPLSADRIYKGTAMGGKSHTPEAFLAMALKSGIPSGGRRVKSGIWFKWSVADVYNYGLAIRNRQA